MRKRRSLLCVLGGETFGTRLKPATLPMVFTPKRYLCEETKKATTEIKTFRDKVLYH